MNVRKIRETLGRSKSSLQRRDFGRAIQLFAGALKELGGQPAPTDLRGDIRNVLADICADPAYKKQFAQPLSYQPGQEKELLQAMAGLYRDGLGQDEAEDYESALQRKMNLDRCLKDGRQFLAQNRPSDADDSFSELFKFYKNEFAVHALIAKAMMDAKEYVRALGYLRNGLKERPTDTQLRRLAEECMKMRASMGR